MGLPQSCEAGHLLRGHVTLSIEACQCPGCLWEGAKLSESSGQLQGRKKTRIEKYVPE